MNRMIILVVLVAYANADAETDALQTCFNQVKGFKGCIGQNINSSLQAGFAKLKEFHQTVATCFEQNGVKLPTPPNAGARPAVPPQGPPPGAFAADFTPSPEFAACGEGAKKAFFTCFKKEANIPEGFKPEGLEKEQKKPPPFGFGGPQFPYDPEEIKVKLQEMTGANKDTADKIFDCVKGKIEPFLPSLIGFAEPTYAACKAAAGCFKSNPFTDDCKARLEKGGKAFCTCRKEFGTFFNTSSECSAARTAVQKFKDDHAAVAAQTDSAAAPHNSFPNHPHHQIDFCTKSPEQRCKEAAEKVANIYKKLGLTAPSS